MSKARLNADGARCMARLALVVMLHAAPVGHAAQSAGPPAAATAFPAKPIRLIVPFAPGGGTDFVARLVAQKLTESLGQTVVIDNRAGASGTIGAELLARAPADGYTLGIITAEHTIVPSVHKKMPYQLAVDFLPVTQSTDQFYIMVVNTTVTATSVKELIATIKASAGRFNFGTSQFSVGHLAGELLKVRTGVQMTHIPYKGTGPALTDLLSGQISLMFSTLPPALPHIKSGRLRALAISAAKRSPLVPELPTVSEAGVAGFEATGWNGFLLPAKTPRGIVTKLQQEIVRTLTLPDVQERYTRAGIEPAPSSPDAFGALIARELAKWAKVVKEANVRGDE
jgi:tripartite-type tricarboxylate transporter receptor subunit TctC